MVIRRQRVIKLYASKEKRKKKKKLQNKKKQNKRETIKYPDGTFITRKRILQDDMPKLSRMRFNEDWFDNKKGKIKETGGGKKKKQAHKTQGNCPFT